MNRLSAASTILVATAFVFATANGRSHEVYVLNSPDNVHVDQNVPLRATELADLVSTIFGFTVSPKTSIWDKLQVTDPFSLPEAVVVLEIPGLKNPGFNINIDHHNLILDESLNDVYTTVESRMKERLENKEYSIMHGSLTDEEFLKSQVFHPKFKLNPSVNPQLLDSYNENNKVFFDEIYNLRQLGFGVKESGFKNDVQDFHWFQLQGVKKLISVQEQSTEEKMAAEKMLNEAVSSLVQSYKELYDDKVLFIAITSGNEIQSQRKKRELGNEEKKINVAETPDQYYPAIFNLLLWFTVIFIFSLIAISLSIAQMDPGRDSIIYRMTSNRMKKEN